MSTKQIGRYTLLQRVPVEGPEVSEGAQSIFETYEAVVVRSSGTPARVYLKRLIAPFVRRHRGILQELFIQELSLATQFVHPGISPIFDLVGGEEFCIVRPMRQDASMADILACCKEAELQLTPAEVVALAAALCRCVEYVHQSARYITFKKHLFSYYLLPSQLRLSEDGHLQLAGIGENILLSFPDVPNHVKQERLAYSAPEQLQGQSAGLKADLFAMGILLYEWAALHHPFTHKSMEQRSAILSLTPPPLQQYRPDLSDIVCQIISHCLQKAMLKRPSVLQDLHQVFHYILAEQCMTVEEVLWGLARRLKREQPDLFRGQRPGDDEEEVKAPDSSQKFGSFSELAPALKAHYGVPAIDLQDFELDPALVELISAELAEKHRVLPVIRAENTLIVAMLDPSDLQTIDQLQFVTGCQIDVVVCLEEAWRAAFEKLYEAQMA